MWEEEFDQGEETTDLGNDINLDVVLGEVAPISSLAGMTIEMTTSEGVYYLIIPSK